MSQKQKLDSESSCLNCTELQRSSKTMDNLNKKDPNSTTKSRNKIKPVSSSSSSVKEYFQKTIKSDKSSTSSLEQKTLLDDSLNDFQTPKVPKKKNDSKWKLNTKVSVQNNKKSKSKNKIQNNSTLEILKSSDSNVEHLEMAIALSKSTYEAEYGCSIEENEEKSNNLHNIILDNMKPTNLERFGFKSCKSFHPVQIAKKPPVEGSKRGKNRFRFITPILNIRTNEERESIISTKISEILNYMRVQSENEQKFDNTISSSFLQPFIISKKKLFNNDLLYEKNEFYVGSLELPKSTTKAGYFIKSYSLIPGRDVSPNRISVMDKDIFNRSISPDLFPDEPFINENREKRMESEIKLSENDKTENIHLTAENLNLPEEEIKNSINRYEDSDSDSLPDISEKKILKETDADCCIILSDDEDGNSSVNKNLGASILKPDENSSILKVSRGYKSSELNITEYVKNLLEKSNYSFDVNNGTDSNGGISQNKSDRSFSSHSSFIEDEEINYSCRLLESNTDERESATELNMIENYTLKNLKPTSITPDQFLIKTKDITPMLDYDTMNTPVINKELEKIGVKPLKRARGAKLLTYVYESTHPIIEIISEESEDEDNKIIKRRKKLPAITQYSIVPKIEIVGDALLENEQIEDLIFERKQSVKIPSCRIPLQIVWFNFLCCNPAIKENILLYEPLQLEVVHMMLKDIGFKFHIQDLLTFFDKKCITIRTAQNNKQSTK